MEDVLGFTRNIDLLLSFHAPTQQKLRSQLEILFARSFVLLLLQHQQNEFSTVSRIHWGYTRLDILSRGPRTRTTAPPTMAPPKNPKRTSASSKRSAATARASPPSKRQATSKAVKGGKAGKGKNPTVTKPLSSLGFLLSKRPKYQIGTKILLDESIYDDDVPDKVKDHLFVYEITKVDENGKQVQIQYKNLVIRDGGSRFWNYVDSQEPQVSRFVYFFFVSFCLFHSSCTNHHTFFQ
jgi:hypothetical protein